MTIRFYNTLSHREEVFSEIEPGKVTMYNCGPTVYDFAHIGNFRAFVFADVLRRFLELTGKGVHQVMNLTDVGHMTEDDVADGAGEDKMQVAGRRLKEAKKSGTAAAQIVANPDDPYQVAQFYIDAFVSDAQALGLKIADEYSTDPLKTRMPRATDHVGKMMKIILKLVDNGHAYVGGDGAVYYDVQTFPEYGKLSGNTLDKLRGGAGGRVLAEHQAVKKHPADFLLWKPDASHIMKWDPRAFGPKNWESPFGVGYPGWHIECSAMAQEMLGRDEIDIHTGGEDNIFPHHECEIAQSRGASGKGSFARYWLHTRFLLVDGQKMSKSKGNFFTVRGLMDGSAIGGWKAPAAVIRFELLKSHYRSNMNFTVKGLKEDSFGAVTKLRNFYSQLEEMAGDNRPKVDRSHPVVKVFIDALSDDLNMGAALGEVFSWMASKPSDAAEAREVFDMINSVLNVVPVRQTFHNMAASAYAILGDDGSESKARAIDEARKSKDFATADRLRKELNEMGYDVKNTPEGTRVSKRLA
jgi:cysteinyl-tRNA synthetase